MFHLCGCYTVEHSLGTRKYLLDEMLMCLKAKFIHRVKDYIIWHQAPPPRPHVLSNSQQINNFVVQNQGFLSFLVFMYPFGKLVKPVDLFSDEWF